MVPKNGYAWETYTHLVQSGLLDDIQVTPWESGRTLAPNNVPLTSLTSQFTLVHPELHFVSHLPQSIMGEQLIAQFLRCIPERSWLFHYGRVPMSVVMGEWVWQVRS